MAGDKKDESARRKAKRQKRERESETMQEAEATDVQPSAGPSEEPEKRAEEPEPAEARQRAPCPVVGVGASAGGLEALQGLFEHVSEDLNAAFVVVQHRAADRTSVMRSLLEKHTQLTVKDIEAGMKIESGTLYLGPAEKDVSILNGVLFLIEPPPHVGVHLPIDSFFRSLAQDEAERAIGIVLSGTGSDGTLGLKEIKAAGGLLIAQEETQAKYDSMPRSAIDTGLVDFVLPVEKMGEQLAQYLGHPLLAKPKPADVEEKHLGSLFQKIFILIRGETGHDFSHYKRNTIQRRIARRMAVHQIDDLSHYVQFLQENPAEVNILAKEMLITVTNFFRDRAAFEKLQEQVIAPLVSQKAPDSFIRVWVAGCATGEEAYSIAMMLYEEITRIQKHFSVQVFATDIDEESIETGRRGQYPKSIAGDVSPARLSRFFTEENSHYKIKSSIREMMVFAKHNLTKDSPFSKLDLLCCRNVLIYMDSTLQKKLIPMFHYTLNPGGILFLGESESIGTFPDLFTPIDARHKIFRRKPVKTGYEPDTEAGYYPQAEAARKDKEPEKKPGEEEAPPVDVPEQEKDGRIRELEQELQSTKEYLQTTIEELETGNEELKSTNEELDTSREELQSTNEELRTVNSEYQQKIDDLSKGYDDLNNLMTTAEVATLFLDRALRIRRFTPMARKTFRLIERDVGRPLADIVTNLKYEGLIEDIKTVLDTLTRVEKEVQGDSGRYYQMRIVPYRTAENIFDGAVVTFVDITGQQEGN